MIFRMLVIVVALSLSAQLLARGHGGKRFFSKVFDKHSSIINSGKQVIAATKNNLAQKIVAGGIAVTLACGGFVGCSNEDGSLSLVLVTDTYQGEYVYFVLDGLTYQGYVSGGVSASAIEVILDNGNPIIIDEGLVDGVLLPNHPDVGSDVYLHGEHGSNIEFSYATVNKVFNDAVYELIIDSEIDYDGNIITLAEPYAILVSSRLRLEEGGFEFFD